MYKLQNGRNYFNDNNDCDKANEWQEKLDSVIEEAVNRNLIEAGLKR